MNIDIPADWPATGTLFEKIVKLDKPTLEALSTDQLREVVVDVPGRGPVRPWRFEGDGSDVTDNPEDDFFSV